MSTYVAETITNESGSLRARVILDDDSYSMMPDGCCFGTVYTLDTRTRHAEVLGQDPCVKSDLSRELGALWRDLRDMDEVEAVLRGKANVCRECGAYYEPSDREECTWAPDGTEGDEALHLPEYLDLSVVGFDYIERDYGKMVNIITLADLQHWGHESLEVFRTRCPGLDPAHGNLTDWEAWADGDVYYVVVEERVVEHVEITSLDGSVVIQSRTSEEAWYEIDSCHGFYGTEYALEEARGMLDAHEAVAA